MKVFDYLGETRRIQVQHLNLRFYNGIVPNWMFAATISKYAELHTIRFSFQPRPKRKNLSQFEWPAQDVREGWHSQKELMLKDLHLKTIEHSRHDGEFNFVLSNGERTESESYKKMVEFKLPPRISKLIIYYGYYG